MSFTEEFRSQESEFRSKTGLLSASTKLSNPSFLSSIVYLINLKTAVIYIGIFNLPILSHPLTPFPLENYLSRPLYLGQFINRYSWSGTGVTQNSKFMAST